MNTRRGYIRVFYEADTYRTVAQSRPYKVTVASDGDDPDHEIAANDLIALWRRDRGHVVGEVFNEANPKIKAEVVWLDSDEEFDRVSEFATRTAVAPL